MTKSELWHVYADGEWLATEYDGWAPVNVMVGERMVPVVYRHLSGDCCRDECKHLLVWG
ncbi:MULTISPECIES: hypothetical protein [unclassified Streptomyces]|uniref:hypothetical protein n=1 Tax=unclassified Streptomyces TaxID=2593676 RepID=UPI00081D736B|nr:MULTISPECIES: hypothetical protein [unclassified Streptomyces]MYR95482.1 hypothetical protein [Streptomyces sp. SID4937]SCD91173.1 hypothetical protein GA0115243_104769 [Streptomyces sp. ScaeMP-e83]